MNRFNPENKRIVYLHVVPNFEPALHYYLKLDTIAKTVIKVVPNSNKSKRGRNYLKGITELQWTTFTSNEAWYFSDKGGLKAKYNARPRPVKYTTKAQFDKAVARVLESLLHEPQPAPSVEFNLGVTSESTEHTITMPTAVPALLLIFHSLNER